MHCEGSCEEHTENVELYHVWYGSKDWGLFWYCDNAVKEDISRGMTLEKDIK